MVSILKRLPGLRLLLFLAVLLGVVVPARAQVTNAVTFTNQISFISTNFFVFEDSIVAAITVRRSGEPVESVFVDYRMQEGTAISGVDFIANTGTLLFMPGETLQSFFVQLIDNFSLDGNRALNLSLENPVNGESTLVILGDPSTAVLTIRDDESSGSENSAGEVEIARGNGGAYSFFGVAFDSYAATTTEWAVDANIANFVPHGPAGPEFTIIRRGGARGRIEVDWTTSTNVTTFFPIFDPFGAGGIFFDAAGGIGVPGQDFIQQSGTVVMDDYQMATNVVLRAPINGIRYILTTNGLPGITNVFQLAEYDRPTTFAVEITAVRPAPEEVGHNINPTIGTARSRDVMIAGNSALFAFHRLHYEVDEGHGIARINVKRSASLGEAVSVRYVVNPLFNIFSNGGDHLDNTFALQAGSDYAAPFIDFEPPGSDVWRATLAMDSEARLEWGDNDADDKQIVIPIIDDEEAEFDEDLLIVLYKLPGEEDGFVNPYSGIATLKIRDNDQPAGASDVTFNPDNNPLTNPPYNTTPGANNTVQAVLTQPDGKVILGGDFTAVNTVRLSKIARLNFDGSTDLTFTPGNAVPADGTVRALAQQPDGRIIIAGAFDAYNGIPRFNIARLLTNGVLDASFNPGLGTDGPIRAVALQEDGKILIGGDFTMVDGTNQFYLARLLQNGKLDTTFDTGFGPNAPVNSIAVSAGVIDIDRETSGGPAEDRFTVDTGSSRGTLTINYDFLTVPDSLRIYYGGVAIYDSGFTSGSNTVVVPYPPVGVPASTTHLEVVINENSTADPGTIWFYSLQIAPDVDPNPVIGGEFTSYNGRPANFIARLNLDGSMDDTFQTGTGADDTVYAVAKQGNKVVMAGDFNTVDLRSRRGIARLNENGSLDTEFQPGSGFDNSVYTVAIQPNGKPVLGGVFRSFNETRRIGLARLNLDGTLDTSFMDTAKNQFAGVPNPLNPENIASQENFIRSLSPYRVTNITILTNILVDTNGITNEILSTNVMTKDHIFVGGRFSRFGGGFERDDIRSRLNIARVIGGFTPGPGNIAFMQNNYSVDENAQTTFITLVRTNGSLAPISAQFDAFDSGAGPGVAQSGVDYESATYVPLWVRSHAGDREYSAAFMGPNFNAFTTNRARGDFNIYQFPAKPLPRYRNFVEDNIFITIHDDNISEGDEVIALRLTAPDEGRLFLGGQPIPVGTALGKPEATLTIADNDFSHGTLGFGAPEYFVNENGVRALINITRVGGSSGTVTVDVRTQNGTASNSDYTPLIRPRTVTFLSGQTNATLMIDIADDVEAELEETVLLLLTNATGFPGNIPAEQRLDPARSTATLSIIDNDFASGRISFTAAAFDVNEAENEIVVTVRRSGGSAGDVIVSYRTEDDTAQAGLDYVHRQGTLQWSDGDSATKSFTIPLIGDDIIEGEETFNIILSDPTVPDALGAQRESIVRIQNDDAAGRLSFSQLLYSVDENGPYADITVVREGGISGPISVRFAATNLTAIGTTNVSIRFATNGVPDYVYPEYSADNRFTNILNFAEGQTAASFRIPMVDDSAFQGEKRLQVMLFDPAGGALLGNSIADVVIIDDEANNNPAGQLDTTFLATGADSYVYTLGLYNDGRIMVGGDFSFINDIARNRLARLNQNGTLDASFDPLAGPNGSVRAIDIQNDGRMFVAGLFSQIGGTNRNHLGRLNIDANVDPTFDPGAGTDNPIYTMIETPEGKAIIVGNFTQYRGVDRRGIARVNTNGVVDASFNPGTGANGTIWTAALQRDGKILIGGDFTTFNNVPRNRIARLNRDGSLDRSFGEGQTGASGSVRSIVVQQDGNILIGGLFTNVNGRPFNRVARLVSTGAAAGQLDESFNMGIISDQSRATNGANGSVNVIALQLDGKILLGGDFTQYNSRTRNRITRLNPDGSLDPTINFGSGANGPVSAIVVQPDRRIILGGGFTEYDGQPRSRIARIHGGAISGSGRVQFVLPFFSGSEHASNAIVSIRRTGGTTGPLTVTFLTTTNETAVPGVDFTPVTNVIEFAEAETFRTVLIPLHSNPESFTNIFIDVILTNVIGGEIGLQPRARITIVNEDSRIEFSRSEYSVSEDVFTGSAAVTVRRVGSVSSPVTFTFLTVPGTATPGADYEPVAFDITFGPGDSSRTVAIPIYNDTIVEGPETVQLVLTNLVGSGDIPSPTVILTIDDNDFAAGQIEFQAASFTGSEGSRQVLVRVRRVGGTTGVIAASWETRTGGETPAQVPSDFQHASGIVSFSDGEVSQSFVIPVFDDQLVEGNETFIVRIFNPTGGAIISGPSEALAVIVDDDLPSGSLDRTFNPGTGANGEVRVVRVAGDSDILIGGNFTVYNDVNRSHIARLTEDGGLDEGFDPGIGADGPVSDLEIDPEDKFYIGGDFNTVEGLLLNRVARLQQDGSADPSFQLPLGANAQVIDVVRQPDGKVVIGGMFTMVSAADRRHIARLNVNGTVDQSFNPGSGTDGDVFAVVRQDDGKILIGGAFTTVNGVSRRGIARLNADGSVDNSFNSGNAGAAGTVHDILILEGGRMLIVGDFTSYNGVARSRVALLNADGTLDQSFDPGVGPNRVVYAIAQQMDGKFIIVGDFTSVSGITRNRIARLNSTGAHDTEFRPGEGANDAILSVAIQPEDGRIVVGGRFTEFANEPRAHIARLNNDKGFISLQDVVFEPIVRVNGHLELRASTQPGFSYTLETASDLDGNWTAEQSVVAQGAVTVFEVTPSLQHQFFRIRRE